MTANEAEGHGVSEAGKNDAEPQPPESVLVIHFNGCRIDLPCESQDVRTLRDALIHIRRLMNVPSWMVLSARDPSSASFFDEKIRLSEVLQKIDDSKYLEVSIELSALSEMSSKVIGTAKESLPRGEGKGDGRAERDDAVRQTIPSEDEVYPFGPPGVVIIRRNMLPILRDHIRNDHTAIWINRICGGLLGSSITIGVTLFNNGLSEMFRSNLKIAFCFCVGFLLALAGIEKYGRSRRSNSLETLISNSVEGEHSG